MHEQKLRTFSNTYRNFIRFKFLRNTHSKVKLLKKTNVSQSLVIHVMLRYSFKYNRIIILDKYTQKYPQTLQLLNKQSYKLSLLLLQQDSLELSYLVIDLNQLFTLCYPRGIPNLSHHSIYTVRQSFKSIVSVVPSEGHYQAWNLFLSELSSTCTGFICLSESQYLSVFTNLAISSLELVSSPACNIELWLTKPSHTTTIIPNITNIANKPTFILLADIGTFQIVSECIFSPSQGQSE